MSGKPFDATFKGLIEEDPRAWAERFGAPAASGLLWARAGAAKPGRAVISRAQTAFFIENPSSSASHDASRAGLTYIAEVLQ